MEYRAYVQYDWNAVDSAELSVSEGQIVIVRDVNDRGWALVHREDTAQSGWVPNDYLRPLDDDENEIIEEIPAQPDFSQEQVQNAMNALSLANQAHSAVSSQPQQPQQHQQQQQQHQQQIVTGQSPSDSQPCGACGLAIESSALIAKGKHYHQNCFQCSVCHKILSGGFLERDGEFFCEEDYYKSEGFVCAHCNEAIAGARIMGNGKPYHIDHLLCSVCNISIGTDVLHVKDDKNICHNCYNSHFAAVCATCNQPIELQIFSALDKSYHKECFVCHEGGHPMPDESFHAHEGNIYCPEHYKKLFSKPCHSCKQDISGQYLEVVNHFFHPNCWKCTMCDALLESTGCSLKNDQFYCPTCVVKVPSLAPVPQKPVASPAPAATSSPAPAAAPKPTAAPSSIAPKPTAPSAPAPAKQQTVPITTNSNAGLREALHQGNGNNDLTGQDLSTEEMRARLLEISERALALSSAGKAADMFPSQDQYTYAELLQVERLPASVVLNKRESYLSDEEFDSIFKMDKNKFASLKIWKQQELKKGAKLF